MCEWYPCVCQLCILTICKIQRVYQLQRSPSICNATVFCFTEDFSQNQCDSLKSEKPAKRAFFHWGGPKSTTDFFLKQKRVAQYLGSSIQNVSMRQDIPDVHRKPDVRMSTGSSFRVARCWTNDGTATGSNPGQYRYSLKKKGFLELFQLTLMCIWQTVCIQLTECKRSASCTELTLLLTSRTGLSGNKCIGFYVYP